MDNKETNLDKALNEFINAMRLFISTELIIENGDDWEEKYVETLYDQQKRSWKDNRSDVQNPSKLIDFGNLSPFAIKSKFFYRFVNRGARNFPSKFIDISQARNMLAHYGEFDQDKSDLAYAQMIYISKKLEMIELEKELRILKDCSIKHVVLLTKRSKPKTPNSNSSVNSFKKSDAIKLINNDLGTNKLSHTNTVYSNINKTSPCWWLNIPPNKFNESLNMLLIETDDIIWINLPKKTCSPPEKYFNTRKDNKKIDLRIGIDGDAYLKDNLSTNNFDFKPYLKKRIRIK